MLISYDRRPNATVDEKMQSLVESIMLALNEKASQDDIDKIKKRLSNLESEVNNNG